MHIYIYIYIYSQFLVRLVHSRDVCQKFVLREGEGMASQSRVWVNPMHIFIYIHICIYIYTRRHVYLHIFFNIDFQPDTGLEFVLREREQKNTIHQIRILKSYIQRCTWYMNICLYMYIYICSTHRSTCPEPRYWPQVCAERTRRDGL